MGTDHVCFQLSTCFTVEEIACRLRVHGVILLDTWSSLSDGGTVNPFQ